MERKIGGLDTFTNCNRKTTDGHLQEEEVFGVLEESTCLETVGECRDDARHQVAGARHSPCPQARHPRLRQGQGAPGVLLALPEAPLSPRQALQVRRRPGETQIW